ncbi:MAG: beta strand repeat-containing protein, partial [Gammaproteobacteria bacterium]
ASSGSLTGVTSILFDVTPASPAQLAFTAQPSPAQAGATITPAIQVTVRDQFGNVATGATANVTVAITSGTGSPGAQLAGSATRTPVSGVATFSDLSINRTGNAYTLTATSGALSSATSAPFDITPGAAALLAFTAQPADAVAGVTIAPPVEVTARDALGNTVSFTGDVTVALGTNPGGDGVLDGTKMVAAVAGVATFSDLNIDQADAGYTLSATSGVLTPAASNAFTISAAAPNKLAFTVQPSDAVANASISPAVQVTIQDQFGNRTGATSNVTVALGTNPGGDGVLDGTKTVAAVAGVATFSALDINQADAGYTLTATSGTLIGTTSSAFTISPAPASQLAFTAQPTNVGAGAAITPAVQVTVRDAFGNRVTTSNHDVTVAINPNPGGGALFGTLTVTANAGVATFADLSVDKTGVGHTLSATATGLGAATSGAFDVTAAAASRLAFTIQPSGAVAGVAIAPAVQVTVQDQFGNTVTNAGNSITVAIGTGPPGATLDGTTPKNAVNGVATFSNLSIGKVGAGYTLTANATGLTGASSATFTITHAAANRLAFTVGPTTTEAGQAFSPALQVTVQDQFGNTVTDANDLITLAIGSGPGGSSLNGDPTQNAVNGVATFPGLSINRAGTGYTLTASVAGLAGATSGVFSITAGAATQLAFVVQPSTTVAGATISPAIQVAIQDQFGNTVPGADNSSTVAIGSGPGGATLDGTTTKAGVGGFATFDDLTINRSGTGYTLTASATGLTGATSGPFNINPGPASRLAFTTQPINATAGVAIAPEVQVSVQDALGNLVTGANHTVTVAIGFNAGGGTLSGAAPVAASGGVATFPNLSIEKTGTGYTLTASATGLTGTTSAGFNITAAAASQLAFTVQPASTVAGASIMPAVEVTVRDQFGNRVPTATDLITVAVGTDAGGGATLGGDPTQNASGGIATFPGLNIDKTGTGYTLTAAAAGLGLTTSTGFPITPAAPNKLAFVIQPANTA